MEGNRIRETFLRFFEERGHRVVPSSSLIPPPESGLLLTNAGMNQFIPYFLGHAPAPFARAVTAQKCFRAVDIDNVGRTDRHETFFEMLGNFSFGDYFKRESCGWGLELVTEVWGIDLELLWVTVYETDDEAIGVWREIGIPAAYFMNVPGLKIVAPGTPRDAKGLMTAAIRDPDPVLYLEHKFLYRRLKEDLPEGEIVVPIGKARLAREGKHLSIVTYAAMLQVALEAAEAAARDGIDVEVLDLRTLLPLDQDAILATARKTGKLIVLHEATRTGGPGGEVAALVSELAFEWLDAPLVRIAPPDTPVPYSPPLEEYFLPNADKVGRAIRALHEY